VFSILTHNPPNSIARISLPLLTTLEILNRTDNLDGDTVATMVESLYSHLGEDNHPFPRLAFMTFGLEGLAFDPDVEARLEIFSSLGFLHDLSRRVRLVS
jgi:hypothetical protein